MRRVQPRRGVKHPECERRRGVESDEIVYWSIVSEALEFALVDRSASALIDGMIRADWIDFAGNVAVDAAVGGLVPWSPSKVRWDDWAQVDAFLWWRCRLLGIVMPGDDDWVDADLAERWDPRVMGDATLVAFWEAYQWSRLWEMPAPELEVVAELVGGPADRWPKVPVMLSLFEESVYSTLGYFADALTAA